MSQTTIPGIEPAPEPEKVTGVNALLEERLKRFARYLVLGHTEDGSEITSDTHAAELAGIGSNHNSSRNLSARYKKHPVVKAEMHRVRTYFAGQVEASAQEVWGGWRDLLQQTTGQVKVKVPVYNSKGEFVGNKPQRVFKPDVAERVLEKMAKAVGVLDEKSTGQDGAGAMPAVIIAATAEVDADEWAKKYGSPIKS